MSRTNLWSNLIDWGLRLLVAAVFLYEGTDKFGSRRLWIRLFADIGIGQWFRYATGIVEVVGGVLMLIPRATTMAVDDARLHDGWRLPRPCVCGRRRPAERPGRLLAHSSF